MFGLSWTEIAVVAGLSAMLLRPEDLPVILRGVKEARKRIGELRTELGQRITDISRELEFSEIRNQLPSLDQPVDPRRIVNCLQSQREYGSGSPVEKGIALMSNHNTTSAMAEHGEQVDTVLPTDCTLLHGQK